MKFRSNAPLARTLLHSLLLFALKVPSVHLDRVLTIMKMCQLKELIARYGESLHSQQACTTVLSSASCD
jgi:hypothetical protein